MAANLCSNTNHGNSADLNSQEKMQSSTEAVTMLSELSIPQLEISSTMDSTSDENVMGAKPQPNFSDGDRNVTKGAEPSDVITDTKRNITSSSNDLFTTQATDIVISDSMTKSMVETDAVPLENTSKSSLETCLKSSDASKSSLTESAESKNADSPIDEDDAGPFNQNAYRRHLIGGNLCYETFTIKDSPYYNINEGRKLALIFNHENYNHYDHQNIPRRTGTRKVSINNDQYFQRV